MAPNIAIPFILFIISIITLTTSSHSLLSNEAFLQCLHLKTKTSIKNLSKLLYFPNNNTYSSFLLFSMVNTRFNTISTPKPLLIFTPTQDSHIQGSIICAKNHNLSLRVRSGGHDYEGLSSRSQHPQPFIILDLINLNSVTVNVEHGTAWVQAGATLGEVYYQIANKSSVLGFPAGICPSVGVGGHISGGGMGTMVRKYGLAADNVLDVRLVDVHGRILDKDSMGEDLFWAVRGGGAASFGVVLSWKLRLVPVPQTVTVFAITKSAKEGAVELIDKWQYIAYKLPEELFIEAIVQTVTNGSSRRVEGLFNCLFLGNSSELVRVMGERFPELGVGMKDCKEMSWVQSVLFFGFSQSGLPADSLMDRKLQLQNKGLFKAKSDFVREPVPKDVLERLWSRFMEVERASMFMDPYGGKMAEISESETPFPHRKGTLYNIQYLVGWSDTSSKASKEHIRWIRSLYKQMGPYVSRNPRAAYLNFRDLDLGRNEWRNTSYFKAKVWGVKYFKNNFKRLAFVKGDVDPENFFRNEQSIPPLFL
ncbi:berberine bridge enzyme-like 22 [Dioscorea cayenensis subsp. rotundata]|uniref:Berberine bridge enzyme-like 22 n=1 Tax=Dioscorea cayennensis subsp. rotundata TaxID=55577 RepID=A0AB40ANY9_DIOCR|nr:berberine bridge enzyme-like 22 [Dioscorea cayenensis subsp. rotundata]